MSKTINKKEEQKEMQQAKGSTYAQQAKYPKIDLPAT